MVFANNAVYSQQSSSIHFPNGSTGVTVAGNVVLGSVTGANSGTIVGNGLSDFVNMSWNAVSRDGTPSPASALLGQGNPVYAAAQDIQGNPRTAPVDAGASERP